MSKVNADQIAEWNGAQGQRWAELQRELDGIVAPFGEAALRLAAPQPGEHVIDIGCGCGDTSVELGAQGRRQRPRSWASTSRSRCSKWPGPYAKSELGRTSSFARPMPPRRRYRPSTDLLFSRFGVMFFAQPVAGAASPAQHRCERRAAGLRLLARATRQRLGHDAAVCRAQGHGRHAGAGRPARAWAVRLCRRGRLRAILADAGFEKVALQRFDATVRLGVDAAGGGRDRGARRADLALRARDGPGQRADHRRRNREGPRTGCIA